MQWSSVRMHVEATQRERHTRSLFSNTYTAGLFQVSLLCAAASLDPLPVKTSPKSSSFVCRNLKFFRMIQTISPYAASKTAEIMSRYRPIAPKPEAPAAGEDSAGGLPNGISKSPYLRNVWAHLQARPTRTRKRNRSAAFSSSHAVKRSRPGGISVPKSGVSQISIVADLVDSGAAAMGLRGSADGGGLDLNAEGGGNHALEELDFLSQLQRPLKPVIISPRPVRPVGSTVIVEEISDCPILVVAAAKAAEEVETAVEAERIPAIVSDANKKVRIANSAYKEMTGQPECGWLDCASLLPGGACRRIGGEVLLQFADSEVKIGMNGFRCRVRIEWESDGKKKSVSAACTVEKIECPAKDYQFLWRFESPEYASCYSR